MWRLRSAEAPKGRTESPAAGFSLVEVIVAIGLTMTVLVAVLPQLIVGIRGAAFANNVSAVKGAVQGHLEQLRNLPYYVAHSAERRYDLLDTYFPNMSPPTTSPTAADCAPDAYGKPTSSWDGYVTTETRCGYETEGPFYRKVTMDGQYVLVTNLQFLRSTVDSAATAYTPQPAVMPAVGDYDSTNAAKDGPVTSQVAVTVTALYRDGGRLKAASSYTQISDAPRYPWRLQANADAAALSITSADQGVTEPRTLSLRAGVFSVAGSLSRESSTSADLTSISVGRSPDEPVETRLGPVITTSTTSVFGPAVSSVNSLHADDSCSFGFCWGEAPIENFTASAENGLPGAGTFLAPLEARLTGGVSFGNTNGAESPVYRPVLMLDPAQPMVSISESAPEIDASGCGSSRGGRVSGRGYMATTATQVDTCAEAAVTTISLFPTTFAPKGVIRIRLDQAMARCTVDPATTLTSASIRYGFEVLYADPAVAPAVPAHVTGYSSTGVLTGSRSRTLAGAVVNTVPAADVLSTLLTEPVAEGLTVGSYIESWSSPTTTSTVTPETESGSAEATLEAVIELSSQALRRPRSDQPAADTEDPSSVISATLGSASCYARDER